MVKFGLLHNPKPVISIKETVDEEFHLNHLVRC